MQGDFLEVRDHALVVLRPASDHLQRYRRHGVDDGADDARRREGVRGGTRLLRVFRAVAIGARRPRARACGRARKDWTAVDRRSIWRVPFVDRRARDGRPGGNG
eukprot:31448-Pelagococcus_subviridis.AAC.2